MRRVIGIDTHRTFGEVVIWEDGRLRHAGRINMTRMALEGFGKSLLAALSHQPFLLLITCVPAGHGFNKFNALTSRQ
jgi:hypothetical protein